MHGINESSRVGSNAIDTAVLLYHTERGYLLACLDVILKTAKDASVSEEVRTICYQFMEELMKYPVTVKNNTAGTYVSKILSTLEDLSKSIVAIQNTGTVVGQVPEAGSGKLGDDVSSLRMERLGDERVYIVQILYHIASLFTLETKDTLHILELLEDAELTDSATSYVITALVAALSRETEKSPNLEFITAFHNRIMTHGSRVPVIKAVVVLKWILYLSDPERIDVSISNTSSNRRETDIQQLLEIAIANDVFGFMNEYLLYFQQPNAAIDTERRLIKQRNAEDSKSTTIDKSDYHNFNADIRVDFQPFVLHELEKLSTAMIRIKFGYLQHLKYKEEDTNTPVQAPLKTDNALLSANPDDKSQCHDLADFLTFLASVYRDRVNGGIIYWTREKGGLNHFTRWLLDIKVVDTVRAAFDFLGSIATGNVCADYMFHYFMAGVQADIANSALFSWGKPFSALQFYSNLLKDVNEESKAVIPTAEEELILKFLNILKQTVQYSKTARIKFWSTGPIQAQYILFDLLNRPTSTGLRAALFDVLSAFCSAWGGGVDKVGHTISKDVWRFLEDSDMLIAKRKIGQNEVENPHSVSRSAGIIEELRSESVSRVFTETLSVIQLIGSVIHTESKREALITGFQSFISSIPQDLGKGTKYPGSGPYISLVVDDIFVNLATQKYAFAEARWQLTEACLMVMENSIESFDLSSFENNHVKEELNKAVQLSTANPVVESELLSYLNHPGFQVIIRILSGGRVVNEIFGIIEACAQKENKEMVNMPYHQKCLVRSLRILLSVLEKQGTFCKVLLPYIVGFSKRKASSEFQLGGYNFAPLPSVVPLGQLILFQSNILERIGLLVNYEEQEEICFLSTKILHHLSIEDKEVDPIVDQVKALNRVTTSASRTGLSSSLTSVLSTSKYSEAIIFGLSERLSINVPEITTCDDYEYDTSNIPFWMAEETLSNTYSYPSDFEPRITSSVRLAILDLLLENSKQEKTSPTLTEFLLGYDLSKTNVLNKIQDTEENKATLVCFHTILAMLRQGIEKHDNVDAMVEGSAECALPFVDTHPILAEKCYQLIYRLCARQSLSLSTMRYLRSRENFFYNQFDAMSSRLEDNLYTEDPVFAGRMVCADGTEVKTDFFKLRSKLHQRAWILQCIALELHTTINMHQKNETSRLLDLLYGRKNGIDENDMDTSESGIFSQSYQQPLVKMLEFVSSLEFVWVDNLVSNVKVKSLNYFKGFDVNDYLIMNERGCQLYDTRSIYRDLRCRQDVEYANSPDRDAVETEMGSILNWCMAENHTREIAQGRFHCLEGWKQVIHITLIECFDLIEVETRENMIYELLTTILTKIMHSKEYDGNMLKSMSEVVLALFARLKKEKIARPAAQLPIEKLRLIFSGIVDAICQDGTTFQVRGDLYTAITAFLLYIKQQGRDQAYKQLEKYILDIVSARNSKLLDTLCTDATHGLDIWKTTAYICLDALNKAALRAGSDAVQSFFIQNNFLQYTIEMIRSDDAALTNLLEQKDGELILLMLHAGL